MPEVPMNVAKSLLTAMPPRALMATAEKVQEEERKNWVFNAGICYKDRSFWKVMLTKGWPPICSLNLVNEIFTSSFR